MRWIDTPRIDADLWFEWLEWGGGDFFVKPTYLVSWTIDEEIIEVGFKPSAVFIVGGAITWNFTKSSCYTTTTINWTSGSTTNHNSGTWGTTNAVSLLWVARSCMIDWNKIKLKIISWTADCYIWIMAIR